jgi:hypothetical protein
VTPGTDRFFPDFFVVGAPRCGTTSLCRQLAQHPQICFSKPKEPHYFSRLAPGEPEDDLESAYLGRCFRHRGPQHLRTGEGSVSYLYSTDAIERILAHAPDARFVAHVRNPLEMLPSYHLRMLYLLEEDEPDFATAWRLQEARARGERIPSTCWDPRLLQYREAGSLGHWVERLVGRVGRDRVHVVVYDDYAKDPQATYEGVLRFLGLEPQGQLRFPRKQRSRGYRSRLVQRLLYRPPLWVARLAGVRVPGRSKARAASARHASGAAPSAPARRGLLHDAGRALGRGATRLHKRLVRWNQLEVRPTPLAPAFRAELCAAFASDVETLSRLLGRDLSPWLRD